MKDIFIKTNEFTDRELYNINKYAYRDYRNNDIMSVEELVITIEELLGKCEELEEELEQTKDYDNNRETFDYSEWKANQE
jgi:hypothetical protein